jgi:recA bacterial DNA recombination protein
MTSAATLRARLESSLPERLSSVLLLRERAAPLTVSTGVAALDALTGGLPRGALSEIAGPASSGRTGVMLAALAAATLRQEVCALVDASDCFDPASAAAAGVNLERLLWVRCSDRPRRKLGAARTGHGRRKQGSSTNAGFMCGGVLEQVLKVTDLLLQGGGFGMVVLDLGDIPPESARRVPLTSWFRFRRAVEPTATVLLLVEQEPCAKTCASLVVRLEREAVCARDSVPVLTHEGWWNLAHGGPQVPENNARVPHPFREAKGWESGISQKHLHIPGNSFASHAVLLRGMRLRAEVVRSSTPASVKSPQQTQSQRLLVAPTKAALAGDPGSTQRKPLQSVNANFELRAAW